MNVSYFLLSPSFASLYPLVIPQHTGPFKIDLGRMRFVLRTTTLAVFSSFALLRCHFPLSVRYTKKKHWPSGGPGTKGIRTEGKGCFGLASGKVVMPEAPLPSDTMTCLRGNIICSRPCRGERGTRWKGGGSCGGHPIGQVVFCTLCVLSGTSNRMAYSQGAIAGYI